MRSESGTAASADAAAARAARGAALFDRATDAAGLDAYREKIARGEILRMTVVDEWQSTLIRSFTPLPANRTTLQLEIRPGPIPDIAARVIEPAPDGEIRFGIRNAQAYYQTAEEERSGPDAADVKVYLESLWLYLSLPQRLGLAPGARTSASALPDANAPELPKRSLKRVFVSPGGSAPAPDRDQYILWLDPESDRVSYVEFTYREVFDFYQGALYYGDHRGVSGLWLPFTTKVTDGIDDPDSVHTIWVESAEFATAQ